MRYFATNLKWIEVKVKNELFLIGLFYSPSKADVQFFNSFNSNIEKALEHSKNLVIAGDLNKDLLTPNFHNLKDVFLIKSMILDPIIIPEDLPFLDSGSLDVPDSISDHKATNITLPFQYELSID